MFHFLNQEFGQDLGAILMLHLAFTEVFSWQLVGLEGPR